MSKRAAFGLKPAKKPKRPVALYEKDLKKVLYPYIKKRDGNTCFSCGKLNLEGRDWNAGHFFPASWCNFVYRYDPRNIHSQCSYCNRYLHGNYPMYRIAMVKHYGNRVVNEIEKHHKKPIPKDYETREWLTKQVNYFKELCITETLATVTTTQPVSST